jgi:hypothetical protein
LPLAKLTGAQSGRVARGCPAHAKNKPGCHRKKAHGNDERAAPRATLSIHISAVFVDLHFKLGLGQFLEKRYTSIETFAA